MCGSEKPTKEFYKNHQTKDGLSYYCKECDKKRNQELRRRKQETASAKAQNVPTARNDKPNAEVETVYIDRDGAKWFINIVECGGKVEGFTAWKKKANGRIACVASIIGDRTYPTSKEAQYALDDFAKGQPNWKPEVRGNE